MKRQDCDRLKLQQDGQVIFPPELVTLLDRLEGELLDGDISEQSQQWLAQCGLTAERMRNQLEPVHTPQRTLHLYHCDHRGLPLALINEDGHIDWSADYDAWGNVLSENNPHHLQQHLRLPGQQYDEETGLHYNRHRYYNPRQGRYITQDPIGLKGGWNLYQYPLDPLRYIDPLGLDFLEKMAAIFILDPSGAASAFLMSSSADGFARASVDIVGRDQIHNGSADALRHCYWTCRMTQSFGPYKAFLIGLNHEMAGNRANPPQPQNEAAMDMANNGVGISCGLMLKRCSDSCVEKYNSGGLYGLGGKKLSPITTLPDGLY